MGEGGAFFAPLELYNCLIYVPTHTHTHTMEKRTRKFNFGMREREIFYALLFLFLYEKQIKFENQHGTTKNLLWIEN